MKEVFKKFKLFIIISSSILVVLLVLALIPTNYDLMVPARISAISKVYSIGEDDDADNINIYSVSVMDYDNTSVLSLILSYINPYALISEHNNNTNTSDVYQKSSGNVQKEVSLNNALIAAYNEIEDASVSISYHFEGFVIHSVYGDANNNFLPGDVIIEINDVVLTENSNLNNIIGLLNAESNIKFKFIRNNEQNTITVNPILYTTSTSSNYIVGISTYLKYSIDEDLTYPTYSITNPSSYGPSAGLMQSLYVYECLSNDHLTDGLKIVGTGTVSVNGNAGTIGGIKAKIIAASLANADIFFVPSGNYNEALEVYNTLNTKMQLVEVNSLSDCIDYLMLIKESK